MKKSIILACLMMMSMTIFGQNNLGSADDAARIAITPYVDPSLNFNKQVSKQLTNKMTGILTKQGLAGSFGQRFIITANVDINSEDIVVTTTEMYQYELTVNFIIGDGFEGTKFAMVSQEVKGLGETKADAYLAAIKEQNGAAMSLGRVSTFFDIYIERDLKNGVITEEQAQELMDDFVIKLRIARHLRTPDYNELFGGDPMWITEALGGMGEDGRTLVSKSTFRMLNTLYTLGSSPEPNLTVLWSNSLPENFKKFCAKVSSDTDSIQYENDDIMRPIYGDDYAIACCVSAMKVGKQMQFFGARCNLAKLLLIAINGGYDSTSDVHIGPQMPVLEGDKLDYDAVSERFDIYIKWLSNLYVNTMNVIHFMHDKYAYEKTQMALHDTSVERFMAFGIAGLSVVADSLSAIKYADVKPIKDENGFIVDFDTVGDFPKYGNDDDRVDLIAKDMAHKVITELRKTPTYREAIHTLSVLTITSNVMYGKNTGATPDGRAAGAPFAPGANPMHNREENGALASLNSVAKISYDDCRDGISNTFSITPDALGRTEDERVNNLVSIIDGYFAKNAHHININVLNRETLEKAYEDPEAYPNLTIRVSGYAVNFHKLSKEQQREVISRTFHEAL